MAMNWQQELLEQTIAAAQPEQRAKKVSVPITRITTNPTADRVERPFLLIKEPRLRSSRFSSARHVPTPMVAGIRIPLPDPFDR